MAEIAAGFIKNFDAARERCWIAEMGGEPVGSVFLVEENKDDREAAAAAGRAARARQGLGRRLVRECIAFARAKGYRKLVLWTQSNLAAARAIYQDRRLRARAQREARQLRRAG